MKRLIVLIVMLLLVCILPAQQFWGLDQNAKIIWANTFRTGYDGSLDSLEFVNPDYYARDYFFTGESLFTQLLVMDAENYLGIGGVSASFDTTGLHSDAVPDSLTLYVRLYFNNRIHERPWGAWHQLGGYLSAETNHPYLWQIADSSWWLPNNGVQFMSGFIDVDGDTIKEPNLGYYNK